MAGVYPVTLTVTNESSTAVSATSSIYIYDAVKTAQEQGQSVAAGTCVGPGALAFNVAYAGGAAGAGKNGRSITFRGRGNTWIGPGTSIEAQDGGDGSNENGAGYVRGGRGGKGAVSTFWCAAASPFAPAPPSPREMAAMAVTPLPIRQRRARLRLTGAMAVEPQSG
ncbi:MAG: hypothetical protein M5U34_21790 [Chloroflexi bacterium]|nr:hypothetical protein [Chloroflexota bacterium]